MKKESKLYNREWRDSRSGKTYRKPKKFLIYIPEIQDKIQKEARKAILKRIKEYNAGKKIGRIVKVTIFGSFLHKEMGLYYEKYQDIRYGSDIDMLCIVEDGFRKPRNWKLNTVRSHSTEYQVDAAENYVEEINKKKDAPVHPINFLIHILGKNNYEAALERLPINEKISMKRGFKVDTVFLDKKRYDKLRGE
jgi:hypothetical protein